MFPSDLYSDDVAGLVNVQSGVGRERVISPVVGQPCGEQAAPVILPHCKQSQSVTDREIYHYLMFVE